MIQKAWQYAPFRYGSIIALLVVAGLFLLPGVRMGGFLPNDFLPHATCYLRDARLIWLHAISDSFIGLAYLSISATLGYLVYRARDDIPFHWMFMAFGLFIVTCGLTHVMAVITVWHPIYWLSGDVKVVTAVASVATAVALPFLLPRVFSLIHSVKVSNQRKLDLEKAHSEMKRLYEQVKELDDLKSQFFANVSHELRTPLTLILGPAGKLGTAENLSDEQRSEVVSIDRNARLLLKHVNDLLEASRLEAGRSPLDYAKFDLSALLRLTLSHFGTLAHEQGQTMKSQVPSGVSVEADPGKLQRVILNLLGNAFKFVPAGGKIDLTMEELDNEVRVTIADNGPGIPEQMRAVVFERFRQVEGGSTRRFGGTGLGLSIARDLVELHNGRIELRETPGGGATFAITLPKSAPAGTEVREEQELAEPADLVALAGVERRQPAPGVSEPSAGDEDHPTVLVVEDDPDMNRFISGILQRHCRVVSAFNGNDGLEAARRNRPDLILSDIMMPEMSGDTLLPLLRAEPELGGVPIVILSAKADDELRVRLLREGANDYLIKPFSAEELEAKAANFLSIGVARRALQTALQSQERDVSRLVEETIRRKRELEESLTALRKAEEELRRANFELEERVEARTADLDAANKEMQAFTYSVSHDLRSPLRTISGMADILREDHRDKLEPDARDLLDRVISGAKQMDLLIQSLLAYSRTSRVEAPLTPVSLADALQSARNGLGSAIAERGAQLDIEETDQRILAHETFLGQIFSNLLENAIKYVEPGVTPMVKVTVEDLGERVRVTVTDNGIGIPPEAKEKIFERFQRLHSSARFSGTGLGLAIAAKAAERLGTKISVESEAGRGSSFSIEFKKA